MSSKTFSKTSFRPTFSILRRQLRSGLRLPEVSIESIASKTWNISSGNALVSLPAHYLPDQLKRVTGTAYSYYWSPKGGYESLETQMAGGIERFQSPTRAFLVKDAYLVDGAIHKSGFCYRMFPRKKRLPQITIEQEFARAAVHGTLDGNLFFGLWLTDDCTLYPLAANEGKAITTNQPTSNHTLQYEAFLGMKPTRVDSAHFKEIILFEDRLQNLHKRERFSAIRRQLLSHMKYDSHPGVFIIRGGSGKRRLMQNENEIAVHLQDKRGFRIVDVNTMDVKSILAACAGAKVIAGIEGSHLMHGIMVLAPGGAVLTLQPPDRFCPVIKRTTDRDGQHFAFVVGEPGQNGFKVDIEEVERTLDMLIARAKNDTSCGLN